MDMRTIFPSKYFRVEDLDPVGKRLTIGNVIMEQVVAEWKPVMYFKGVEKGLVINQSNNKILMTLPGFGYDSNGWAGKEIVLFTFMAMQNGQPQARIGVRAPGEHEGATTPAPYNPPQYGSLGSLKDEMNDEIPF